MDGTEPGIDTINVKAMVQELESLAGGSCEKTLNAVKTPIMQWGGQAKQILVLP